MPPDIVITLRADDLTSAAFQKIKRELLELEGVEARIDDAAAKRDIARRRHLEALANDRAEKSRARSAEADAEARKAEALSRTEAALIQQETDLEQKNAKERADIRQAELEGKRIDFKEGQALLSADQKEKERAYQLEKQRSTQAGNAQRDASKERQQASMEERARLNQNIALYRRQTAVLAENTAQVNRDTQSLKSNQAVAVENIRTQSRERIQAQKSNDRAAQLADQSEKNRLAARRLDGQEQNRILAERRLEESRLNREQRANMAQLRQEQGRVGRGFLSWQTLLSHIGSIIAFEIVFQVVELGRRLIEVTQNFERLRLGITAYEGSAAVADAQIRRIRELAELPGVQFEGGLRTITRLRGSGITFEQSERLLREISNLASLAGGSQEDVRESLRQIQQLVSVGRFQTENLRPIFERIPQLRRIFEEEFGGSVGEQIQAAVDAQGLTIQQAFNQILTRAEAFPRAPEDTLSNAIERLGDSFDDLLRAIGGDFLPALKLLVNTLNSFFQFLKDNRSVIYSTFAGLGLGTLTGALVRRYGILSTGGSFSTVSRTATTREAASRITQAARTGRRNRTNPALGLLGGIPGAAAGGAAGFEGGRLSQERLDRISREIGQHNQRVADFRATRGLGTGPPGDYSVRLEHLGRDFFRESSSLDRRLSFRDRLRFFRGGSTGPGGGGFQAPPELRGEPYRVEVGRNADGTRIFETHQSRRLSFLQAARAAGETGGRTSRFFTRGLSSPRTGAAIGGVAGSVGPVIGIELINRYYDLIDDGAKEINEALEGSAQSIDDSIINFENQFGGLDDAFGQLIKSFLKFSEIADQQGELFGSTSEEFNQFFQEFTGTLPESIYGPIPENLTELYKNFRRQPGVLTDAQANFNKLLDDLQISADVLIPRFEQDIRENAERIREITENPEGRFLVSPDELSRKQENELNALYEDNRNILEAIAKIREAVKLRQEYLDKYLEYQRRFTRQLRPDFTIPPSDAVRDPRAVAEERTYSGFERENARDLEGRPLVRRQRRGPGRINERTGEIEYDETSYFDTTDVTFRRRPIGQPPRSLDDLLPGARRQETPIGTRYGTTEQESDLYNPLRILENVVETARELNREFLRTRVDQDAINRSFEQTIKSIDDGANELKKYRDNLRGYIDQWYRLQKTITDAFYVQERGLTRIESELGPKFNATIDSLISPLDPSESYQSIRELQDLEKEIRKLIDDAPDLAAIPEGIHVVLERIGKAIDSLRRDIELSREALQDLRDVRFNDPYNTTDGARLSPEEQAEVNRRTFGTESGLPPTREQIFNHPFFRRQREQEQRTQRQVLEALNQRLLERAQAFASYFESALGSLYDQFIAPSILDLIPGLGSGRSAAQKRAIEELERSIQEQRQDILDDELLSTRDRNDALLELTRTFEQEKRDIERQYEEERSDAWKDWVRQQLTDFPKLIFQQLNLQLAARATNAVLNALGLGGNIPITGPGIRGVGNISGIGGGSGPADSFLTGYGPGTAASVAGQGASLASRFGQLQSGFSTAGTAAGATALAYSGYQAGKGLYEVAKGGGYDDIGKDISNIGKDIGSFFRGLIFENPANDELARMAGRAQYQDAAYQLGRRSARDIVKNYDQGYSESAQSQGSNQKMFILPANAELNINLDMDDRTVKTLKFKMDELISDGRLNKF